jgi:hypothetical protein
MSEMNIDGERNARFVATPTGGKVELMDVYSRDSLRAFLVKLPPTLVAKESGISFDTVKRLQAKGGSVGYKGSSLRKVSAYVNTLLTPLLAE